jgi:WD40 repeat protein
MCGAKVKVDDARSGAQTLSFIHNAPCDCLRYSPDSTRIATLDKTGKDIRVWDAASGQLQATVHVPAKTNQIQFGGCRHVLVTAANSIIGVWTSRWAWSPGSSTPHRSLRTPPG